MVEANNSQVLLSVVIVNYKVPYCLREALNSVKEAKLYNKCEIIVIDNASEDNSKSIITSEFPEVQWIQLKSNIGFGKACNLGARRARGKYLLLLNPDTVISETTLTACVDFMNNNPDAGMLGPKILNPDGTMQASCRRSFPTPSAALFYFSGLSRFFPKSKRFGKYNLTYMDENKTAEVDAISGSFMFMPLSVFQEVGGFDERFFMYGEDIDLCWRIRKTGKAVWYNPQIQIIHLKGKSSSKRQLRSRIAFYEAMIIFSRKYKAHRGGFFPGWLIFLGIIIQASINIGSILIRTALAGLIDLLIINGTLWAGISLRFHLTNETTPYNDQLLIMLVTHVLISAVFLFMFIYNGVYSQRQYSRLNALLSGVLSSTVSIAAVLSVRVAAFTRIGYSLSLAAVTLLLLGWREMLPKLTHLRPFIFAPSKVLIVGNCPLVSKLIKEIEDQRAHSIKGIVRCPDENSPVAVEGYPVLGEISDLKNILTKNQIDILIVATEKPWYSNIIEAMSRLGKRAPEVRWVPQKFVEEKSKDLPETVPLHIVS
ncbi:glycosyltransferase [Chitinispirillales bacterium ANBcel5]|uniref:glycosyltransferase n=1 Tax=Cellulosispirillum alkaliphilum TaxID=3039283 RepID=UPI002A5234E2|nr:glycosyltransferase [Chitinispirillales bacterium ANBcel5]